MLHTQRFSVSYEYPIYFGRGVFSADNPALAEAVCRREHQRRHRAAFLVEARVAACWPGLVASIERYAQHHAGKVALVAPPLVVPGGEDSKNDPRAPLRVATWLDEFRMDRQSFLVVVGGGALQDMAGYAAATTTEFGYEDRVPSRRFGLKRINIHNDLTYTPKLFAFHLAGYNNVL